MNDKTGMPAPGRIERDEGGRLIYLTMDSVPPFQAEGDAWLVAVDGSPHALRATAEAARQAEAMKACALHLAHVQPWLSKEAAESELATRGWAASSEARALLDAAGRPWRLHVAMGEVADTLIGLASRLGCRGIIIGSHGEGAMTALLLGSVAQRVSQLSSVPVTVVH